jgi:diadenosine tetraphosphate (Ap4A) HIT family hydrolase
LFRRLYYGQISCPCDSKDPETLRERQCALCAQVEKAPPDMLVAFVKDSSPAKPDRWLALPRSHSPGMHQMSAIPADARTELWREAMAKAKELWGDQWAVAYNAERLHTQCHVHIHIGRMIEGVEWGDFKVVDGPADIPLPGSDGLWIHPVNGKLHVHLGEQVTENVLLR